MYGPRLEAEYERDGATIKIELCAPKDEAEVAKQFTKWMNAPRIPYFLSRITAVSQSFEENWLKESADKEGSYGWFIYVDEKLVGDISLSHINLESKYAELGIVIGDREYWGRGVGKVSESMIIDYAFNNIVAEGLNKIIAYVYKENQRSYRALEKIGFKTVGTYKKDTWKNGRWHDIWCGEILNEEWIEIRRDVFAKIGVKKLNLCPECEDIGVEVENF